MALHPIKTTQHLRENYIRYLKTIKTFQDPWLRAQFANAIEAKEALVKGPLLEASPPFVKTLSIKDLVNGELLSSGFKDLCSDSLPYERELYQHQELAIRKIVSGRNIVVSTGTGSGKTEAFLIPILNRLLEEERVGTLCQPGIRAMLLYPLNALANDQVKRLRRVLLNYPQITFGRYIGETAYKRKEANEQFNKIYPDEPDLENELLSREEMQKTPPHIFLTNFAMLEYLLLRPVDSVFFDGQTGKHWSFIVLDEAHVYDGAQANEIGMLMRRLEQRVVGSDLERLQAIATSATIGGGVDDFPEIVKFGKGLFNLPFEWENQNPKKQDVVSASRLPVSSLGTVWGSGDPQMYEVLKEMAEIWRETKDFTPPERADLDIVPDAIMGELSLVNKSPEYLFRLLRGDQILHQLRKELEKEPQDLADLGQLLFPGEELEVAENAISDLVSAAVLAKGKNEEASLLPARYHVFARALEGAFICLNTGAHKKNGQINLPNLFLNRHKTCPHCASKVFELANCTRCGKAYLIGVMDPNDEGGVTLNQNSMVYEAAVTEKEISYFVLDLPGIVAINEDVKAVLGNGDEEIGSSEDLELMKLCSICGSIRGEFDLFKCGCEKEPIAVFKIHLKKKKPLQRCVSCSTRSNRGVVYRFLTGQDPPVSVLVDAIYQHLPGSSEMALRNLPGKGRKLLNFTDSRQKAAFFASFVERTHNRNLRRRLIILTITEDPEASSGKLRLPDLVNRITHRAQQNGIFADSLSTDARSREVAIWLMKEFSPLDRRISLEGVGLVKFKPIIDPEWEVPDFLKNSPWNLSRGEAESLIIMLLNTLRMNGAITYLRSEIENLIADEAFAPRNRIIYVRGFGSEHTRNYNVIGWNPAEGYSNGRLNLLKRYLLLKGLDEIEAKKLASSVLGQLWDYISSDYTPWGKVLLGETIQEAGVLFRIRHDMWQVIPSIDGKIEDWYICNRCLNISSQNAGDVCPTFGCQGSLVPLENYEDIIRDNLYRDIYLTGDPIPLSAEEHTAQWVTRKAAEVQNRFIQGEINLLSCSTTFELGVDVGDLQSVVMRNVPPSTANYVQRAGRAGRRTDSAALALTFAQRRPHDLSHYQNPKEMVSGQIKPPVAVLHNEKIVRRHIHSVVFASFLRWVKNKYNFEYRRIGEFFDNNAEGFSGAKLLRDFLQVKDPTLLIALQQILPEYEEFNKVFSLETWRWLNDFSNDENKGVFDQAEVEYQDEIRVFQGLMDTAVDEENYYLAGRYQKIQKQIRNRNLFGFLANRNVLPKYGFPTDVVTLKTDHLQGIPQASQIDLSRDLRMAISEFAPGSQVIAAKRIWHSAGVRKFPRQHWEPYQYAVCPKCEKMIIQVGENVPSNCSCGHVFQNPRYRGTFIVPEHGFVASQKTSSPGETSPDVFYSSQVYFANYGLSSIQDSGEEIDSVEVMLDKDFSSSRFQVLKKYSRNGWLAVVNNGRGRGFNICNFCGYTQPVVKNMKWGDHENPLTGGKCSGGYSHYHFGHRFMTDVLELHIEYPFNRNKQEIYSVLYAILTGASIALGIKRDDLNGTVYFRNQEPAFIIYDNVPGGAGHVARVSEHLFKVFQSARDMVANCECGEDTSCYACLRNYHNQYFHDDLVRGLAERILSGTLEKSI